MPATHVCVIRVPIHIDGDAADVAAWVAQRVRSILSEFTAGEIDVELVRTT